MSNCMKHILKFLTTLLIINIVFPVYYMKYAERTFETDALDPINSPGTWRQLRFNTLMHGRLWYKDDKMQNIPDLVESLPDQSNSKETVITIRNNARWQDGQEITSADVIFSFNLYRDCEISEYSSVAKKLILEKIDDKNISVFRLF